MVDWLNRAYDKEMINQSARSFALSGNLQLLSFLSKKGLQQFKKLKFKRQYIPKEYSCGISKAPSFANSKEFKKIICMLAGKPKISNLMCFSFENGDYTVLYDALKSGKGVVMLLEISDWKEAWGGYTSYLRGNDEIVRVVPKKNALFLINTAGLRCFTKYVNHHAKHPRIFLYAILHK